MAIDPFTSGEGLDVTKPVEGLDPFAPDPNAPGPFKRGLGAGIEGVKANLYGAGALAAHAVGATGLEQSALAKATTANEAAAPLTSNLEDVDWTSPGSIANHFKFLLGNAIPSLALMAAGGVVGRGLGAVAGRFLTSRAAQLAAKTASTYAGAVAPDVALEAGGIYPEALQTGVENPATRSAVGGLIAAVPDFLPLLAAEKYLKPLGKGGFGALFKGMLKGAPVGGALEGVQELGQAVIERAAAGQSLTDPAAISDYINSFAGGAAPGLLFGAAIGAHRGAKALALPAPTPAVAPTAVAPAPVAEPTAVLSPADAEIARHTELTAQHAAATQQMAAIKEQVTQAQAMQAPIEAKLEELKVEMAKPTEERRAKSEIMTERRGLATQAKTLKTSLNMLDEQWHAAKKTTEALAPQVAVAAGAIKTRQVLAATPTGLNPAIQSKAAPLASEIIANANKPAPTPAEHIQKAVVGVQTLMREQGLLHDLPANKLGGEVTPREQALQVVAERGRGAEKPVSEKTRQGAVETAVVQVAQPSIKELVSAKQNLTPEAQGKLTIALTNVLNTIAREAGAQPTAAEAQSHIMAEVPKALKGRVASVDAEQVAKDMSDAVDQAHTLYSKAGANVPTVNIGLATNDGAGITTTQALTALRGTGAAVVAHNVHQSDTEQTLVAQLSRALTPDEATAVSMALNQEVIAQMTNGVGELYGPKADAWKPFNPQYFLQLNGERASNAGMTQQTFDALPPVAKEAAIDAYNAVMAQKGADLIARIKEMVGNDPNLTVETYRAIPGVPVGSYTRVNTMKSIIAMATNAMNELSVADHEGFHYAEDHLLTGAEKQILNAAFAPGKTLYNELVKAAQQYDRDNKTQITPEIQSNPREAHAYGFEFWRREGWGSGEVSGPLQSIFEKIRNFFERVASFIRGQGFQSIEDIFYALDHGQFSERQRTAGVEVPAVREAGRVRQTTPGAFANPSFDITPQLAERAAHGLPLFSKAAVDMARRFEAGELEREQMSSTVADMIDHANLSLPTFKQAFGAGMDQMLGGLQRWRLKNIATGNYISRFSRGYANVQKTLLAYVQRKSALIAQGSLEQLSSWHDTATNQTDITAVGKVLLQRTDQGMLADSDEFRSLATSLTEHQRMMLQQATEMIAGRLNHEFSVEQKTMQSILPKVQYEEWFANRQTQVSKLIAEGYVPERRYGDYTVHIFLDTVDKDGKPDRLTLHYEQFENQATADLRTQQYQQILDKEAPELKVETGYRYKVERDASISIQQFMDTARRNGITLTQKEKERLARALVSADSMRRNRMFRRKNIPGYSEDIMRVLHEFVVTTANKVAYAEFASPINDAIEGKPVDARTENGVPTSTTDTERDLWREDGPQSGFYRNLSDELSDYVLVPDHGGNWSRKLRGAAMTYFIGGSLAAGVVNAMSIPMNVVPWLSMSTDYVNAFSKTFGSTSMVLKNLTALRDIPTLKNPDIAIPAIDAIPGLRQALVLAAENGTTMDTEIHQIMGMAQGANYSQSRRVQRAMDVWMSPFKLTEQINRLTTFIAAYRVGQDNKLTGRALYDFSSGAVDNTQNRYDEVNRPGLARDPVWALLFMFKSFPLFMIEMLQTMYKENPKSAVYMMLGLTAMTGVQGWPFAEAIEDVIDTVSQRLFNSPFNVRRAMKNTIKDASEAIVGADLSELVLRGGINDMTGLSMSSRIGMGDFIPGTRIGAADNDYGRTAEQILGAPFQMVTGIASTTGKLLKGDFLAAMRAGGPVAVRNLVKGAEQFDRGYAEDAKGRKLVDVTGPEAFWQSAGFSSAALNKAYVMDKIDRQTLAFYTQVRADFMGSLVQAVKSGDQTKIQDVVASQQAWNTTYPDMPISLSPSSMRRDLMMAGLPLNARTLKMLPKQLRGSSIAAEGIGQAQ